MENISGFIKRHSLVTYFVLAYVILRSPSLPSLSSLHLADSLLQRWQTTTLFLELLNA